MNINYWTTREGFIHLTVPGSLGGTFETTLVNKFPAPGGLGINPQKLSRRFPQGTLERVDKSNARMESREARLAHSGEHRRHQRTSHHVSRETYLRPARASSTTLDAFVFGNRQFLRCRRLLGDFRTIQKDGQSTPVFQSPREPLRPPGTARIPERWDGSAKHPSFPKLPPGNRSDPEDPGRTP